MDQDIIILLKKYVSNNCTRQELEQVRQIIAAGNHGAEWDAVLQAEAANDVNDELGGDDFDSARVLGRINDTITPVKKIRVSRWAIGAAASLLLVLSAGLLFWKARLQAQQDLPVLSVVTAAAQQKKIILTDGTSVVLNCGSTLHYKAGFNGAKREVYLNGEAFFNVKHDVKHPFLVHTGRIRVQVLGTSFNVKAYQADARATVSVASGKVGVNALENTTTYMLLPGDRLAYNNHRKFTQDKISTEDMMGWQKGILGFHLETIQEIAPQLERFYGVAIHMNPGHIPNKLMTASFTQQTLPQILEILSQTGGFTYTINKNEIQIK